MYMTGLFLEMIMKGESYTVKDGLPFDHCTSLTKWIFVGCGPYQLNCVQYRPTGRRIVDNVSGLGSTSAEK